MADFAHLVVCYHPSNRNFIQKVNKGKQNITRVETLLTTLNSPRDEMGPLKDSTNTLRHVPVLEFSSRSPPKLLSSPTRRSPAKDDPMNKPPGRVSPFKGTKANMTADQIFATTPRRVMNSKAQSVDRSHAFPPPVPTFVAPTVASSSKAGAITFDSLMPMASSKLKHATPSRMITSNKKRAGSQSDQPISRVANRSSSLEKDPASNNLMDSFTQRSILKRKLTPPAEENDTSMNESEMDLTTSLNTMKNAESAKNVMKFLKAEATQPRKKRAVTFERNGATNLVETTDSNTISDESDMKMVLRQILKNQEKILERLAIVEARLDKVT